jgi:hypothetical protein
MQIKGKVKRFEIYTRSFDASSLFFQYLTSFSTTCGTSTIVGHMLTKLLQLWLKKNYCSSVLSEYILKKQRKNHTNPERIEA